MARVGNKKASEQISIVFEKTPQQIHNRILDLGISITVVAKKIKYERTHISAVLHGRLPMSPEFYIAITTFLDRYASVEAN